MTGYLIDEYPLILLPSLAKAIGLNQAVMLQQVHYWMRHSSQERDGFKWVYKTYPEWQQEFPFWSIGTIQRIARDLEVATLLVATNKYNRIKVDKTKWYRPNYDSIARLQLDISTPQVDTESSGQVAASSRSRRRYGVIKLRPSVVPETTPETSTDKIKREADSYFWSVCVEELAPRVSPQGLTIIKAMRYAILDDGVSLASADKSHVEIVDKRLRKPIEVVIKEVSMDKRTNLEVVLLEADNG